MCREFVTLLAGGAAWPLAAQARLVASSEAQDTVFPATAACTSRDALKAQ